jgi:hypothetical protein
MDYWAQCKANSDVCWIGFFLGILVFGFILICYSISCSEKLTDQQVAQGNAWLAYKFQRRVPELLENPNENPVLVEIAWRGGY